jgi:hypothetical protein
MYNEAHVRPKMQTTIATIPTHSIISCLTAAASRVELVKANIHTPTAMAAPSTDFRMNWILPIVIVWPRL